MSYKAVLYEIGTTLHNKDEFVTHDYLIPLEKKQKDVGHLPLVECP